MQQQALARSAPVATVIAAGRQMSIYVVDKEW